MYIKDLLENKWLVRILLVTWISSTILVLYMVNNLNMIIHGALYDFGLQFNYIWADPYWISLNLIYASLGLTSGLAFFAIMIGFYRSNHVITQKTKIPEKIKNPKTSKLKRVAKIKQSYGIGNENGNGTNMIISCPKCRKVFGRPMVMLNFEGGKTRLINVCPYCNHDLGQTDDHNKSGTEFHIRGQDKTESDQRLERP